MQKPLFYVGLLYLFLQVGLSVSCTHEPLFDDDMGPPIDTVPIDTTPVDTMMIDTTDTIGIGIPCDPNMVYFDLQIMPLLHSNCAFSGCHDAASAQGGVIIDSYESVMATLDIEPFDLQKGKLYERLTTTDEDKRMPPPPDERLSQDNIQLIAKWILQGAKDLECDPDFVGCDTSDVSFSQTIRPLLNTHCVGCHSGPVPTGGLDFTSYNVVKGVADEGRLVGAISWSPGFENMPYNGTKLSDCNIDKIRAWVNAGALNN